MQNLRSIGVHVSIVLLKLAHAARLLLARMTGRSRIHGVRVILERDRKILLVRHYHAPWIWCLPGGGIDGDETLEHASIREVKEETGLNVHSQELLGTFTDMSRGDTHLFKCAYFTGTLAPTVRFEIKECKWFKKKFLPKEIFEKDRSHIENYLNSSTPRV